MSKKYIEKVSKFENATNVFLKHGDVQIRLLARHDNKDSEYVSWYYELRHNPDLDKDLIAREEEMYSED